MNLKDCRAAYDYFSGTASTIARQLGFAGIAIIWIFKTDQGGVYRVPPELIWPGLLLVGALAADFLHYLAAAVMWGGYHRHKERKGINDDQEFLAARWVNWPGNAFFGTKLALVVAAYALLIVFLVGKLNAA